MGVRWLTWGGVERGGQVSRRLGIHSFVCFFLLRRRRHDAKKRKKNGAKTVRNGPKRSENGPKTIRKQLKTARKRSGWADDMSKNDVSLKFGISLILLPSGDSTWNSKIFKVYDRFFDIFLILCQISENRPARRTTCRKMSFLWNSGFPWFNCPPGTQHEILRFLRCMIDFSIFFWYFV